MAGIEQYIAGSRKLVEVFGGWPHFHDAEVIELLLWRGDVRPGDWDGRNVFPVVTAKIHIFIEQPGSCHTLATLRFEDVDEFKMEGFNYQNAILGLSISIQERGKFETGEDLPPYLMVEFRSAFGMGATFRCFRIEVVEALACSEDGVPVHG